MAEACPQLAIEMVPTAVGFVRVARLGPAPGTTRGTTTAAPPFVFVHGYPDNLRIWQRVMRLMADTHDVVAFDWPGLGWSDPIVDGATPFHLGRHLLAVLDALGIELAIPVGFDMGAHAVVAAAASAPDRFTKMVLTNFLAHGDVETSWEIDVMRRLGLNRVILRRLPRVVFRRAEATFLTGGPLDRVVRGDMWESFRQPAVRDRLARMSAGYQASLPRVAKLYPEIGHATLLLWAERDPHFPLAQAEALAAVLPRAELSVLAGLSHWFMHDDPERVVTELRRFAGE